MCNSCVNVCVFLDDYSDPCYGTTAYMVSNISTPQFLGTIYHYQTEIG